jgi:two-component sensor histidine kinase
LQVISSLLDLQAEKFGDEKVREAFMESQSRIISMALIHEELYQEKNIESLNFAAYIRKLSESLFQTYRLDHPGISLQMDLKENVFLNVDIAVPLGIITNELVSNSLKHAFPEQKKGKIQIGLYEEGKISGRFENSECKETEGTKLVLTVSDNGVGISESIDLKNPDTLGLQLVSVLVDQLDGELEFKRINGTEFITRVTIAENP